MTRRKLYLNALLAAASVLVSLCVLVVLEYIARRHNELSGSSQPFLLYRPSRQADLTTLEGLDQFRTLDALLGYAHSEDSPWNRKIATEHTVLPGFVVFGRAADLKGERTRIVILGGSTTDPYLYEQNWPEVLARIEPSFLVINGGVGGYTSSLELLKLIRDVLELKPHYVVSYDGINDLGNWGPLPHPMVHSYQGQIYRSLLDLSRRPPLPIFPNLTVAVHNLMSPPMPKPAALSFGTPTTLSAGEYLVRNIDLMHAVCESQGVGFMGFLQPALGVGEFKESEQHEATVRLASRPDYVASLNATYAVARSAAKTRSYFRDLADVFNGQAQVYLRDGRHLTPHGNELVASRIRAELLAEMRRANVSHPPARRQ